MKKMVLFAVLLSLSCSGYAHAADSTAFDPTRVRIQAQNSIPVGTIIAWHSTGNPADMRNPDGTYNWLECNGQSVSRTVYPELFAVIGAKVPDYRGRLFYGKGGGEPEWTLSVSIGGNYGYQHNDGITAVSIGDFKGEIAGFSQQISGKSKVDFHSLKEIRYFIRARP